MDPDIAQKLSRLAKEGWSRLKKWRKIYTWNPGKGMWIKRKEEEWDYRKKGKGLQDKTKWKRMDVDY